MGMVQVVKTTEGTFGEEDRLVLLQLVQMTSIALEHGQLFQRVQGELLRQKEQEAITGQFLALLAQELHASLAAFPQGPGGQFQRVRHLLTLLEQLPFLQDGRLAPSSAEQFDLVQVAREALREQQALFPHTLLTIHPEPEPLLVRGDLRRVQFVLSTLLNYALTRPLSIQTIQLRVREDVSHGTARVALHYQTASTEESERLFELSYWSRQVATSQDLELGLSLSLSAAIIKRYGGRIWSEQQGTYLHLCFVLPKSPKLER
jgi:signal transduction histidine kinase